MTSFCFCGSRLNQVIPVSEEEEEEEEEEERQLTGMANQKEEPTTVQDTASLLTRRYTDYHFYQTIGTGYFGALDIQLSLHRPSNTPAVVRDYNLEQLNEEQLEEVQRELVYSRMLGHDNIACYACSFVQKHHLCVIQLLMHYGSCADVMHSAKRFQNGFPEKMVGIILRDIVEGLRYLHRLGFVHRSVRAKHFLIHQSGAVKLSGLRTVIPMVQHGERVRVLHHHSSATVDNICWLAPEVLAQDLEGYSTKSDVYSVGIAALELATGEAPFAGLPVTEIFMLKLRGHPPLLLKRQPEESTFSKSFSEVVDKCVTYNSAERPSTDQLIQNSFLKLRRSPNGESLIPNLLLPVMPLDHTKLPIPQGSKVEEIGEDMQRLDISEAWCF